MSQGRTWKGLDQQRERIRQLRELAARAHENAVAGGRPDLVKEIEEQLGVLSALERQFPELLAKEERA